MVLIPAFEFNPHAGLRIKLEAHWLNSFSDAALNSQYMCGPWRKSAAAGKSGKSPGSKKPWAGQREGSLKQLIELVRCVVEGRVGESGTKRAEVVDTSVWGRACGLLTTPTAGESL